MISFEAASGVAAMAFVMVLVPGPNMTYLLSRSIVQGRAAGLYSLAGTLAGFVIYLALANLGLAAIFDLVPASYVGLKVAGAAYLFYLAWRSVRPGRQGLDATALPARDSPWRLIRMGLITNSLNPKTAVIYMLIIPQFLRPGEGNVVAQGFMLGAVQIGVSMVVNAAIVLTAGSAAGTSDCGRDGVAGDSG